MTEKAGKCPICGKPSAVKLRPFCSARCSMLDLGQWLGEGYKVEAPAEAEGDEAWSHPVDSEENA